MRKLAVVFRWMSETTSRSKKAEFLRAGRDRHRIVKKERRYLPQTVGLGRQTPPDRQNDKGEGQNAWLSGVSGSDVRGRGYVAGYICWPRSRRSLACAAASRSTLLRLLRQSRYRRRKANRDQTGIKCGEGVHRDREWAWGRVSKGFYRKVVRKGRVIKRKIDSWHC